MGTPSMQSVIHSLLAEARKEDPIRVMRLRSTAHRGRYIVWAGNVTVIGTFATRDEAREAAKLVLETKDVPRVCGLRDIDAARKVMAIAARKATVNP